MSGGSSGPAFTLACVSTLSCDGADIDILDTLVLLAETMPTRQFALRWIGDGDMRGVLAAQPLPRNFAQEFSGAFAPDALAHALIGADAICVINSCPRVLEAARSAGVPLVGVAAVQPPRLRHQPHMAPPPLGWAVRLLAEVFRLMNRLRVKLLLVRPGETEAEQA